LVIKNLNKTKASIEVKIKSKTEKMIVTICLIKVFISLRLIHKLAKNFTSSIVFALRTINAINDAPSINPTNTRAHRKPKIIEGEAFLDVFFFLS